MSTEHENYLGKLTGPSAIRFERVFPCAVQEVWRQLTDEKLLPGWIADASVDLRVGGRIELRFREEDDPEGYCKGENVSGGKILECSPGSLLKFEFVSPHAGETILTYALSPVAGQALLILDHEALPSDLMVAFAAGWHSYLDALAARLRGEEPQPFAPHFNSMIARYTFVLAASSVLSTAQPVSAQDDSGLYQAQTAERNLLLRKHDKLCHEEDNLNWQILERKRAGTTDAEKDLDYLDKELKKKHRDIHEIELDIRDLDKAIFLTPHS